MQNRPSAAQALLAGLAGFVFLAAVFGALQQSRSDREAELAAAPTTVTTLASTTTLAVRAGIEGFGTVAYIVRSATGEEQRKCALLAETPDQLARGLMGQNSLGGYDAMVFLFAEDTTARFFTANVPRPLSIAWYAADGSFVDAAEMPVCTTAAGECPTYGPARPYRMAFETFQGDMAAAGLGAGTSVTLGGPCA